MGGCVVDVLIYIIYFVRYIIIQLMFFVLCGVVRGRAARGARRSRDVRAGRSCDTRGEAVTRREGRAVMRHEGRAITRREGQEGGRAARGARRSRGVRAGRSCDTRGGRLRGAGGQGGHATLRTSNARPYEPPACGVILSEVRPRFHLRFARCCFAVRLRYASLRMTRTDVA